MRATSYCSGVALSAVASSMPAMAPIWVSMLVAVTTARPLPLGNCRALEHHVEPVAQRGRSGQHGAVFQHRFALAGQRSLLHPQRRSLNQPRIGAHGIALAQHQQVAAHQFRAGHAQQARITHHCRCGLGHARQRGHGVFGPRRLHKTQDAVQDDDGGDNQRVHRPAIAAVHGPGDQRNRNGDQQQVNQRVLKVGQHAAPGGNPQRGAQGIAAVCRQPPRGFL